MSSVSTTCWRRAPGGPRRRSPTQCSLRAAVSPAATSPTIARSSCCAAPREPPPRRRTAAGRRAPRRERRGAGELARGVRGRRGRRRRSRRARRHARARASPTTRGLAGRCTLTRCSSCSRRIAIGVHVDLKQPGRRGGGARCARPATGCVSARSSRRRSRASPAALASLAPDVPRAIGYPRDRVGVARLQLAAAITRPGAAALRAVMPARIPLLLARTRATCSRCTTRSCSRARRSRPPIAAASPVFAWTANDPELDPPARRVGRRRDRLGRPENGRWLH